MRIHLERFAYRTIESFQLDKSLKDFESNWFNVYELDIPRNFDINPIFNGKNLTQYHTLDNFLVTIPGTQPFTVVDAHRFSFLLPPPHHGGIIHMRQMINYKMRFFNSCKRLPSILSLLERMVKYKGHQVEGLGIEQFHIDLILTPVTIHLDLIGSSAI